MIEATNGQMRCTRLAAAVAAVAGLGLGMAAAVGQVGSAAAPSGVRSPVLKECLVTLTDEAKLAAGEAGLLVDVAVKPGDRVRKGDVIARINDDQPQTEKLRAQAEHDQAIAKAESDVDVRYAEKAEAVAEKAYLKAEQSHKNVSGSVTDVERDRLRLEWEKAGLQIEQAQLERKLAALAANVKEAEVKTADINIARRLVTSPFDGQVEKVAKNLGEWLQPGDFIAHIISPDKLEVEGYVDAATWDPEQVRNRPVTVEARLASDRREQVEGRITFVSEIQESGDYRVVAEVPNRRSSGSDEWVLHAGQIVTMTIHSDRPPAR